VTDESNNSHYFLKLLHSAFVTDLQSISWFAAHFWMEILLASGN